MANKTKALKSIGGLAGLAGSVWGAKLPRMRQMLQSVVIPQLTYACSVWYTPRGEKRHNKTHLRHLTSAEYKANRIITGAYKATSAPALDIETFTILVKQKLEWLTSNAMLHILPARLTQKLLTRDPKAKYTSVHSKHLPTARKEFSKVRSQISSK